YPGLSCMALDYLSIPATSVDMERAFSRGHLLILHVWSHLHVQTIWALMCIKDWRQQGLIKDTDILAVTMLEEML
ncbi:hypothetical protein SCLCIDRAFT_51203, partial [Scleroderma citrinum Foug A]